MSDYVAELLLALLGEQCIYLKSNIEGSKWTRNPETSSSLPASLRPRVDTIARMATNVHAIDEWRHGMGVIGPIRRAFIDAVLEAYDTYLRLIENIRIKHISESDDAVKRSADDILSLVMEWYERLDFLHALVRATAGKNGVAVMSLAYNMLSLGCLADWSHNVLESVMDRCSAAFHKVATAWLLDGRLIDKDGWMIAPRDSKTGSDSAVNFMVVKQPPVPSPLASSMDLVKKICEIGSTVHFLKELRQHKTYEHHKSEEMSAMLEGVDKQKIWHSAKARGSLRSVVERLSQIVSNDALEEMLSRQRLLDHIIFIHRYFYMLHGGFVTGLEDAIRDSSSRGRSKTGSRNSSPSLVAEVCVSYALTCSSCPSFLEDLRPSISASRPKGSSGPNLADLFQLTYKPPQSIASILTTTSLSIYRQIFTSMCPHRFLQINASEVWWRLKCVLGRRLLKTKDGDLSHFIRQVCRVLNMVQSYARSIVKYVFEEVLPIASSKLVRELGRAQSVGQLVSLHDAHQADVIIALFLHRRASGLRERMQACLHAARELLSQLDEVATKLEEELRERVDVEREFASAQVGKDKENVDLQLLDSLEQRLAESRTRVFAWEEQLGESSKGFGECLSELRITFMHLRSDASMEPSPYWKKFADDVIGPLG